jgi:hypothetical protein
MDAAAVTLSLFFGWCVIGYGPLALLADERPLLARVLLAPAMGIALVTIPTFLINRQGYGIQSFVGWEIAVLAFISIVGTVVAHRRRSTPLPEGTVIACVGLLILVVAAMALVGWPGLIYGLDWLSFANDDMTNYLLSAKRLQSHGYLDAPAVRAVLDGSDMSQLFWHLNQDSRFGGDLMLALISSLLHTAGAPLFMPTMIALHGALIAAVAGLVTAEQPRPIVAAAAIVVAGINPLIGFSTYSELLAQTGGLSLAAMLLVASSSPWRNNVAAMVRIAVLAGLALFGLFIWYYEVLILVLPALGLYFLLHSREALAGWKQLVISLVGILAYIALLSGSFLESAIRTIQIQFQSGSVAHPSDSIVFPYFLIREGLSSFWGLSMIVDQAGSSVRGLLASIPRLVLGITLFGLAALTLANGLRRRTISACIVAVLSLAAIWLCWRGADFGVFKAVLYLQPFLAALLAAELAPVAQRIWADIRPRVIPWLRRPHFASLRACRTHAMLLAACSILAATSIAQLITLVRYSRIAADQPEIGYFNQLPGGTRLGLLTWLDHMPRPEAGDRFILDVDNSVLTKLFMLYAIGTPTSMISYDPLKTSDFFAAFNRMFPERAIEVSGKSAVDVLFEWTTSGESDVLRLQPQARVEPAPGDLFVAAAADSSVLNRLPLGYPTQSPLVVRPVAGVSNHLAYLPTLQKARHYFDYDIPPEQFFEYRSRIALWPNEPDYFYRGRTMVGAGRYVLLRVIKPSPQPRLMLELTASLKADGDNSLPPVQLLGASASRLGALGRGSARLYSQPLDLRQLGGIPVVGIDMGADARRFTDQDGNLTSDTRRLTSFVRDISMISSDAYAAIKPPAAVSSFPEGLADKNLEYSGIYEDGWIGERAFLRLAPPRERVRFDVLGTMPWEPGPSGVSELVVRVDGIEKARQPLKFGQIKISFELEPSSKPIDVQLLANGVTPLSGGDRRPASIRLTRIGWGADARAFPAEYKPAVGMDAKIDAVGLWSDGWSAPHAELTLAGGPPTQLVVRGSVPNVVASFATRLTVTVDDKPVGVVDVRPGDVIVNFPIAASGSPRRVSLRFDDGQELKPPDTRRVGMLVRSISVSGTAIAKDTP